jgi:hypothetical protein
MLYVSAGQVCSILNENVRTVPTVEELDDLHLSAVDDHVVDEGLVGVLPVV